MGRWGLKFFILFHIIQFVSIPAISFSIKLHIFKHFYHRSYSNSRRDTSRNDSKSHRERCRCVSGASVCCRTGASCANAAGAKWRTSWGWRVWPNDASRMWRWLFVCCVCVILCYFLMFLMYSSSLVSHCPTPTSLSLLGGCRAGRCGR